MRLLLSTLLTLTPLTTSNHLPQPQHIFSNPSSLDATSYRIPTVHESAIQARRILRLERIGTLSTIFPTTSSPSTLENRPPTVSNTPIGLMDYYTDCEPQTGNPTLLAITIATSFKNAAAGSNITLSLRWHPPNHPSFSAAALPRFSLVGYLEDLRPEDVIRNVVPACFVKRHPDAAAWLPGNPIHESRWMRLVVREVYWIGGFGDRAYIGWIPGEVWRNVTEEEIQKVRLPGEEDEKKGWLKWIWGSKTGEVGGWEL